MTLSFLVETGKKRREAKASASASGMEDMGGGAGTTSIIDAW